MKTATMFVRGVEGRPFEGSDGKPIPTSYITCQPFTPTLLNGVLRGDLLEFEELEEPVETGSVSIENQAVVPESAQVSVDSPEPVVLETKNSKPSSDKKG